MFANGQAATKTPVIQDLIRREVVIHLQDGETSIRGFLLDAYDTPVALRLAKPKLLVPDENETDLGGEALVFGDQIKFVQILT